LKRTAFLTAVSIVTAAHAASSDPPVPPGRDPGGVPVAIICGGINYTLPDIQNRLARDGEGVIIGHDVIDDDQHPFAEKPTAADADVTGKILAEGQATTLVALRADLTDVKSVVAAIELAVKMPARIVTLAASGITPDKRELWNAVTKLYPEKLFIVPAGDNGIDLDATSNTDSATLANIIVVTAAETPGKATIGVNFGAKTVDIAVPLDGALHTADGAPASVSAAARIAALAARLQASASSLSPAEMKIKLLSLATPWPDPASSPTRSGFIDKPQRYYWLE
jgi:hypothetical protein